MRLAVKRRYGDHNIGRIRGCCPACRTLQTRQIKDKETTEQELMDQGYLLPAKPIGAAWRDYKVVQPGK